MERAIPHRLVLLSALTLLLALAACGNGHPLSAPIAASTPKPDQTERIVRAYVHLRATGAEPFEYEGAMRLNIVEMFGPSTPEGVRFFSISSALPYPVVADGRQLLFDADLAPGLYRGSGKTYQLDPSTDVSVGGVASPFHSAAYVQLVRVGSPPQFTRFDRLTQPCTLEVGQKAIRGRVDCPALQGADDAIEALHWEWELL